MHSITVLHNLQATYFFSDFNFASLQMVLNHPVFLRTVYKYWNFDLSTCHQMN